MKIYLLLILLLFASCGGGYYAGDYEPYTSSPYGETEQSNDTWYINPETGKVYMSWGQGGMINPETGNVYYNYPNNWKVDSQGHTYKPFGNWYVDQYGNTLIPTR